MGGKEPAGSFPGIYCRGKDSIIEPRSIFPGKGISSHCVLTSFAYVLKRQAEEGMFQKRVHFLRSGHESISPVYRLSISGRCVDIAVLPLGAPLAAVVLEGLICGGARNVIGCGTTGVLYKEIEKGEIIVPEVAGRGEGTSYGYLPPSCPAVPDPEALRIIKGVLTEKRAKYRTGKTWSTDALFRETPGMIRKRKDEGFVCFDMETAALFAVSRFRRIRFGQMLYAEDDISGRTWNKRTGSSPVMDKARALSMAVEACARM